MKFTADRPSSDPETAARKLLGIANAVEAEQMAASTSRRSTRRFCFGSAATVEYSAGLKLAIERGWLTLHDGGTYVKIHAGGRGPLRLMVRCAATYLSGKDLF